MSEQETEEFVARLVDELRQLSEEQRRLVFQKSCNHYPLPPPDHWKWCATGMLGVLQMLAQLSESEIRASPASTSILKATRDQLIKIIDTEQTRV